MPKVKRGKRKPVRTVNPRGYRKKPIVERAREEPEMPPVPRGRARGRGKQNEPTQPAPSSEGPEGDQRPVIFKSYKPLDKSKLSNVNIPVDPCGAASENGVVVVNGNVYLAVSTDDGASFKYFNPTTMFPKFAGGLWGDQQIIYVPQVDRFVWCMLHHPVVASGDGAFRIAFASSADVKTKPKSAWSYVDFLSSDIGVGGVGLDQPHLSYSNRNLIIAIDAAGKGRVVVRIPVTSLTGGTVNYDFTPPLTIPGPGHTFQYSAPCGGLPDGVYMAGHVDTSTLKVFAALDGSSSYNFHDVTVWKWSDSNKYSSETRSGVDWCGRCGSRVSGATWQNGALWFSWMAPKSETGDTPFFPEPHTRVVAISSTSFSKISEMQVWNPKYAFGYSALAVNSDLEIGIAIAWGGPENEADTAFGILGDFVVWYRDGSTATAVDPSGSKNGRWGDFLRTHRSNRDSSDYDGFGYFKATDASGKIVPNPYHVRYGRS
jgi:hypothetical protein